ncbi:MAG: MFS transporter [Acidobacteria bacterium]|nr:MFS transporter [Acidobacteriota bacterium]
MSKKSSAGFALAVLFAINTMNFFDRQILGAVGELIRVEWALNDKTLGALGTAFTLIYAVVGLPLGHLADKNSRKTILAWGVFVWSLLTAASGRAQNFAQMFAMRLGVGIGEATCAPAANSLIGDLFPATRRAKALAIFMLGLPLGIAFSYAVSGYVAQSYGWRSAFYVAGIPGLICAVLAYFIKEPLRGATEVHNIGGQQRKGAPPHGVLATFLSPNADSKLLFGESPFWLVLSTPTMLWIIVSGALHNFNMYTIGSFLAPYSIRFHELSPSRAGLLAMMANGLAGIPGLLLGGYLGDSMLKKRKNGRLLVAALALMLSGPLIYIALTQGKGNWLAFMLWMSAGVGTMYVYYSTVYSAIQDVIEPALRGTAMAIYFFAMYVVGGSFGPIVTGFLSDYFTGRAALAAGVVETSNQALEPFRGAGLHTAMYIIPILGVFLGLVLIAASRTVTKDMEKLETWMTASAKVEAVVGD